MASTQPNIVFILTDQERFPRHMDHVDLGKILPNRARLYKAGVNYENFYINAAPCTPNRSVIFTGLYTQQTWMVGNAEMKQPDLKTAFPTFGTALKELGYSTNYFGKWHLSTAPSGEDALAAYGFEHFPLAEEFHGEANEGSECDSKIADAAVKFLAQKQDKPFLAVVCLVNPHDIMYYPRQMEPHLPGETYAGLTVPANFETVHDLMKNKPDCQAQYKRLYELLMGNMPNDVDTEHGKKAYITYLDYYLWLQAKVDVEIGKVLDALLGSENKENTIVIFTADHGDQIGSHGMSGKQCCVYEETINVPFCVVDYTQKFIPSNQAGTKRTNFGSSVDIFPTIMSLAMGVDAVKPASYSYLSGIDLLPNIINSSKPTRDEVLFTYDFNIPGVVPGPDHIRCYIDKEWKGAVYNHWGMDNGLQAQPSVEEGAVDIRKGLSQRELYKRTTPSDKLELHNLANDKAYDAQMSKIEAHLDEVMHTKLRAPLPTAMQAASDEAKAEYVALQEYSLSTDFVQSKMKHFLG
ncbi:MAG: sulfatase-like hydrolase/transferase [Burkholderiales bacterium]|nr:sulfatase-like hydrolase/transferase [Burkholderiales bacterium]